MRKTTQVGLQRWHTLAQTPLGSFTPSCSALSQQDGRPPAFAWEEEGTRCGDVILTQTNWNNLPCVFFSLSHSPSLSSCKKKKAEVFLKKVVGDSGSVWLVLSRIYYIFIIITVISLTTYFSTVPVENFLLQRSNSLRTVRVALRLTVANPEGCCTLYLTWAVYTLH